VTSRSREEHHAVEEVNKTVGNAFHENASLIYGFIFAKVGNRETAEDLTSQVFLKATRWLALDRSADSIRSWLYSTARSTIVDYWKEQGRARVVPLDESHLPMFCGTDDREEVRRSRQRAIRLLDALPEREREVLRLRFLRGYTAIEVGKALGLTPGNVRVLQLRALRRAASFGLDGDTRDDDRGEHRQVESDGRQ
jgi:RNA polymerase sigma-70 factor (ECF subfamily)